jgi:hypothetical protein
VAGGRYELRDLMQGRHEAITLTGIDAEMGDDVIVRILPEPHIESNQLGRARERLLQIKDRWLLPYNAAEIEYHEELGVNLILVRPTGRLSLERHVVDGNGS